MSTAGFTGDEHVVAIGLLADPGLPATLVDRLHDVLLEQLRTEVSDSITWTVDTVHDPFEEMYPDYNQLAEKAREHVRDTVWDLVVCVTDQPMQDDSTVVVANLHLRDQVAVVSLPALGGRRLRRRLTAAVVAVIARLLADDPRVVGPHGGWRAHHLPSARFRPSPTSDDPDQVDIVRPRRRALLHLLAGMVRVNQPWGLLRGLSRALAGALTGIAFGLLYSSIWTLATSMGPLRLAGLVIAAIVAMVVWIIVRHQLWEPRRSDVPGREPHVRLRNASTLLTVTAGTVAFFLAMLAIAVAAVALVIPPPYLATTLGHPVGVIDYVVIALMASVLGTVAGAVGSGLENDTAVREATYGYREQERRERVARELPPVARTPHLR